MLVLRVELQLGSHVGKITCGGKGTMVRLQDAQNILLGRSHMFPCWNRAF